MVKNSDRKGKEVDETENIASCQELKGRWVFHNEEGRKQIERKKKRRIEEVRKKLSLISFLCHLVRRRRAEVGMTSDKRQEGESSERKCYRIRSILSSTKRGKKSLSRGQERLSYNGQKRSSFLHKNIFASS